MTGGGEPSVWDSFTTKLPVSVIGGCWLGGMSAAIQNRGFDNTVYTGVGVFDPFAPNLFKNRIIAGGIAGSVFAVTHHAVSLVSNDKTYLPTIAGITLGTSSLAVGPKFTWALAGKYAAISVFISSTWFFVTSDEATYGKRPGGHIL